MSCASSTTAKSKMTFLFFGDCGSQRGEHLGIGDQLARLQPGTNTLKDGPQHLSLCLREPRLPAEARDIAICFPALQLPGIYDLLPLGEEEMLTELVVAERAGRFFHQFAQHFAAGDRRLSNVSLVEPKADGVERVNVDPFCQTRFARQAVASAWSERIRQRVGERRQQDTGVGMSPRQDGRRDATPRWSCPYPPNQRPAPGHCSRARPIPVVRGAGRPSTSPTENRARAATPRRSSSRGSGAERRGDRRDSPPLRRLGARGLAARRQFQQRLRSLGGQMIGQGQQRVLGCHLERR